MIRSKDWPRDQRDQSPKGFLQTQMEHMYTLYPCLCVKWPQILLIEFPPLPCEVSLTKSIDAFGGRCFLCYLCFLSCTCSMSCHPHLYQSRPSQKPCHKEKPLENLLDLWWLDEAWVDALFIPNIPFLAGRPVTCQQWHPTWLHWDPNTSSQYLPNRRQHLACGFKDPPIGHALVAPFEEKEWTSLPMARPYCSQYLYSTTAASSKTSTCWILLVFPLADQS